MQNFRTTETQITKEVSSSITVASKHSILFTAGFAALAIIFSFGIALKNKEVTE